MNTRAACKSCATEASIAVINCVRLRHSGQCNSVHEGIGVRLRCADSLAPSVESRELCVMTRVARLFFIIAFMSAAGSCSIELAEKEADTKAMGRQLTDAYYSCVRTSFASQRPTMIDRNMAIEQAFMVCKTEESKLQAFEKSPSVSAHRDTLREELLRR